VRFPAGAALLEHHSGDQAGRPSGRVAGRPARAGLPGEASRDAPGPDAGGHRVRGVARRSSPEPVADEPVEVGVRIRVRPPTQRREQ